MDRRIVIETTGNTAWFSPEDLAQRIHKSRDFVKSRIKEMEESGRYDSVAVLRDGPNVLVNEFAFLDWWQNRQQFQNPSARKLLKPFNPTVWVRYSGYTQRPLLQD